MCGIFLNHYSTTYVVCLFQTQKFHPPLLFFQQKHSETSQLIFCDLGHLKQQL